MRKLVQALMGDEELSDLRDEVINAHPACETTDAELFTGPDLFEPAPAEVRQAREAQAKKVCASCPVCAACLAYALAVRPDVGVWAGLTTEEIRALQVAA
ncbi:WhiB family transcriptional regulator [Nonomuraea sp. NPDC059194]|uniref:WhiB family transcriptional regulator n=1 Tax=Nonomuraea sp. NPDC059194 TaxID=3346764 RepID=UPI003680B4C3